MCANYVPVTAADDLLKYFGVDRDMTASPPEIFPGRVAPFIRLVDGKGRGVEAGTFGMLPAWRRELQHARSTYNARCETVHSKGSFKEAWKKGTRCVIPVWTVYEPRYNEDHTNERWAIEKADGTPFGIAGLYNEWVENGKAAFSYTMITVNADQHPFYRQFHKPEDEKRMPVFLEPEEYDPWMTSSLADAPGFFKMWPGPFKGEPAPKPPRAPMVAKVASVKPPKPTPEPKPPPVQKDLF